MSENEDEIVTTPLDAVIALCNPFKGHCWPISPRIKTSEVQEAIELGRLREPGEHKINDRVAHIERIAWLAVNGWNEPIEIDVGIPSMNFYVEWPVLDGNHRLAAAIVRGDKTILASIAGEVDYAIELGLQKNDAAGPNPSRR